MAMTSKDEELEERLGYHFLKPELLKRALTHSSAIPELRASHASVAADPLPQNNEQLEFLGDAVLDMLASEYLLALFPGWTEGQLATQLRRPDCRLRMTEKGNPPHSSIAGVSAGQRRQRSFVD